MLFATIDKLGTLQYGSPIMHVTGDRIAETWAGHNRLRRRGGGWAGLGPDHQGRADRLPARSQDGRARGLRSVQRLRVRRLAWPHADPADGEVSLQPDPAGPSTEELIAGVTDGIYIVGDKSWSIDMQRYNFQFTGQRFYRIRNGRMACQLRDVAYQATTTDFWNSMEVVGGPQTYVLGGAFNCGKGQPGQVAPVSHGSPSVLMRSIKILNTVEEAST